MEVDSIVSIIENLGFPIAIAGTSIWYVLKTSKDREIRMWGTIEGFQSVLNKFDSTLRDVSLGLKEVKNDVEAVKGDVADLKDHTRKTNKEDK